MFPPNNRFRKTWSRPKGNLTMRSPTRYVVFALLIVRAGVSLFFWHFRAVQVAQDRADAQSPIVYITDTGECYHASYCSSIRQSRIPIRLAKARREGYRACSRCIGRSFARACTWQRKLAVLSAGSSNGDDSLAGIRRIPANRLARRRHLAELAEYSGCLWYGPPCLGGFGPDVLRATPPQPPAPVCTVICQSFSNGW